MTNQQSQSTAGPKSLAAFEHACRVIPGGVNSPARAFGGVGGSPVFVERGEGAYLHDVDGNRYVDYCCSWGPLILGHTHSRVVEAVEETLRRGTSFGAPTEVETELAEMVVEAVPSVEKVRMVNSGTEATAAAIRLARGFTGRDGIVKFAGCYHGHVDALLVQAGSSATTLGVPFSPGIPAGCAGDTHSVPYNDAERVADLFQKQGDKIAAVIVEPVAGNMGVVLPKAGFLEALREITQKHGALLIFDEVITGFRVAYGGAQQRFGVMPDITTLGKILGGGLPVGAYGGRDDVMDHMLPVGKVFQAGTLSGNPLAMACGKATLAELKEDPPYDRLEQLGARLARGLHEAAHDAGVPHTVGHLGSMVTLFFNPDPVTDYASAGRCDTAAFSRWFWSMIARGVYLPCSQFESCFVSAAHTEQDLDGTLAAAREALAAGD